MKQKWTALLSAAPAALMLAGCWDLVKYFRTNKLEDIAAAFRDFFPGILRLVGSELFLGMILVGALLLVNQPRFLPAAGSAEK